MSILHSRQPVWRMLILLKKIEKGLGITLIKKIVSGIKIKSQKKKTGTESGFSLVIHKK
jgi:hypothetical protein